MAAVKIGKWAVDEEKLERQHQAVKRRGKERSQNEPRAQNVHYDPTTERLIIELSNGVIIQLPRALVQGLDTATAEDIAQVRLGPRGASLHWERLGLDFSLSGLLLGIFGTRSWMAALGQQGGSVTSIAKAAAARNNGRKGGRPAKVVG